MHPEKIFWICLWFNQICLYIVSNFNLIYLSPCIVIPAFFETHGYFMLKLFVLFFFFVFPFNVLITYLIESFCNTIISDMLVTWLSNYILDTAILPLPANLERVFCVMDVTVTCSETIFKYKDEDLLDVSAFDFNLIKKAIIKRIITTQKCSH